MSNFTNIDLNIVEFLRTSVDNGIITLAQAVEMGNMVEMNAQHDMETTVNVPNARRVVNANGLKYSSILGVPVVKDPKYSKFWEIMNRECTRTLIEDEITKQRVAGFMPSKVVVKGYRVVVKIDKESYTSAYKQIKHGTLQRQPFNGCKWVFDPREHGFHIDLNKISDNR